MPLLWPHQLSGRKKLYQALERHRRVLCCAPTGSGKTIVATSLAQDFVQDGKRVTFLLPRIEILTQTCRKLDEWLACGYGVITARTKDNAGFDLYNRVQVASVDTLVSRAVKRGSFIVPPTDVVMVDEAHLFLTRYRQALLELYPTAKLIGFTATPGRLDGRGMGNAFDELVEIATVEELMREGYLVRPDYRAPSRPDLEKIRIVRGDYEEKGVDAAMQPLLGNILDHWMERANTRRTIVFCSSVAHSLFMRNQFQEAGVTCEHADANTDSKERDRIFARFRSGETQVFTNVDLATYGFDLPEIDCVVDASPTKSVVKYLQKIGRGLRTAEGKHDCLIHDHAGNIHEHGKAEEDRHWTLQGHTRPAAAPKKAKKKDIRLGVPKMLTCGNPECCSVFAGSLTCGACGFHFEGLAKEFHVVDGELVRFTTDDTDNVIMRARFYCELLQYAIEKAYKPGWADHTYKERFKKFPQPRWRDFTPLTPSPETLRYIRYRNIRRAKQREAQERRAAGG